MRPRSAASSAGRRSTRSRAACATRSSGTSITATGASRSRRGDTIGSGWGSDDHNRHESTKARKRPIRLRVFVFSWLIWWTCAEGHHPRRRLGLAAASVDACGQQAARPDLQQADGVLPAGEPDAVGDPAHPRHHHAARAGWIPAAARRRLRDRVADRVCLAAEPGWTRASVHHRPRIHRSRPRRAGARRQHLLRRAFFRLPAPRGGAGNRRHGVRLPGPRSRALRRR